MEDYQQRWERCLQLIREYLPKSVKMIPHDDTAWVYDTWFKPVAFGSFDSKTGGLVLRVPNRHVYEYIEQYHMPLWSWALRTTFGLQQLSYITATSATGMPNGFLTKTMESKRLQFSVPDARERLELELRRAVGPDFQWLHSPSPNGDVGYDKIVDWLSDNKGRGLLFVGTTGVGKSVMCCDILPAIIGGKDKDEIPVVTAEQMLRRADELKRARVVVIDGLGREGRKDKKDFSKIDNTFLDLCEASCQGGPLLIINTSLSTTPVAPQNRSTYPLSIEERYGREVLDRLGAIVTMTLYSGKSLRG